MKLKFTIHYHTAWGERLHVVVGYHHQDGSCKQQNLAMQTDDGQQWVLETAVLVSLRHPLSHIEYHYQVENGEGEVLRREWTLVPRRYYFDASKDYLFQDQWRDRPLAYHLYTKAYHTSVRDVREEEVSVVRLPLFRRTVLFRVSAPQLQAGQAVAVLGSHPAIGSWNVTRYVEMQYVGCSEWMLSVDVMGWQMPVEYKYVVVDAKSHTLQAWEEGCNRLISTGAEQMSDGNVVVLYGEMLRLCERPWRLAGVRIPASLLRKDACGAQNDLKRLVDWAVLAGLKVVCMPSCLQPKQVKTVADYARLQGVVLMGEWTPNIKTDNSVSNCYDALYVSGLHDFIQEQSTLRQLTDFFENSTTLFCIEDWSLLPDNVRSVLDMLRFVRLESRRVPGQLTARQSADVIASHLTSLSRLCILPLQDWLVMDAKLRNKPLAIEQLLSAEHFNKKLKAMIELSGRNPEKLSEKQ